MFTLKRNPGCRVLAALIICIVSMYPVSGRAALYPEKQAALEWLSEPDVMAEFGRISDAIWSYAELGLEEHRSSKILADRLEKAGFTVERGLAGMPTCFVATYGSGKPVIGLLGEFDALPMISQKAGSAKKDPVVEGAPGHGCGHNMMGTAAIAAAIAVKNVMERHKLKGTIKMFGSPAEETLISRPYMIRAGLFRDVDAVIDNHAGSGFATAYGVIGSAMYSTIFTFRGKTAHGASPWSGRSALDAVEIMNVSANYLREHLLYTHRLHYAVIEGGEAPNVVPDRARVWYYIRNSDEGVEDMYRRVINCAKGAALATDTELEIRCLSALHQKHANKAAAQLFQKNIELAGMPKWTDEENAFARSLQKELESEEKGMPADVDSLKEPSKVFVGGASSDVGDVSLVAPMATINFPAMAPGSIGHHWSVVACGHGSAAWKGLNAGAKAIALSAVDLLTQPEELKRLRDEFEAYSKEHPYKSLLPGDAQPPLDLNRELMNKYRPLLEPYYDSAF